MGQIIHRHTGTVLYTNNQPTLRDTVLHEARTGASLAYAQLGGIDLSQANLRFVNFNGAQLPYAYLEGTDFEGATFIDTDLSHANLREANLTRANLHRADLRSATLRGAALTGANLTFAELTDADFTDTELTGADFGGTDIIGLLHRVGSPHGENPVTKKKGRYAPKTETVRDPHAYCNYVGTCVANLVDPTIRRCHSKRV